MKDTTVILGPPGTGKTTQLLDLIDTYLLKGTDPRRIGFVSFTKKSVNEAKTRAAIRFNKSERYFFYFRTIHSLAFMQLSMTKASVMELHHYREIGDLLGVPIKGKGATDCSLEELEKGDQLVFMESLSRMCCETLEETYNKSNVDFMLQELVLYHKTLTKYKTVNLLNDFTDMLVKFHNEGIKPGLDVLFVDEAQDLCAIQWKIVEQLAENSLKTYIAGDDDQAIFRWSGADIDYFIKLSNSHDRRILDQSYRVPKSVFKLSMELADQLTYRVKKKYAPTDFEGSVEYCVSLEDVDMSTGKWLILVRNIHMVNKVIELLRYSGFAYESQWKSSKDIDSLHAAFNWERLRSGKAIKIRDAKDVLSFMSNKKAPIRTVPGGHDQEITLKEFCKYCKITCGEEIWHRALDKISFDDREYFISARKQGESLINEARIKVSTIHGAKGGECENVVLMTDLSLKTYNAMMNNYDDEVRVFYVGVTRAKKNLYIIQPTGNCYFTI